MYDVNIMRRAGESRHHPDEFRSEVDWVRDPLWEEDHEGHEVTVREHVGDSVVLGAISTMFTKR